MNTFVIEQKSFMNLLAFMQPICTKRTTLETTTYLLLQVSHRELVVKSTDLEISLQASCTLHESTIDTTRSFLVGGKRLYDLFKELDGKIQFTLADNILQLQSGNVNLSLNIKSPEDFPPFPERIENLMQFDSSFLLSLLNKVTFLIPQNNSNPALNGLFLEISSEDLRMTTTDGHCLAQVRTEKYSLEEPKKWLLPRRAVFEVKKLLEGVDEGTVFLGVCGNQLVFSGETFNFFTKLLVDSFPQYDAILDKKGYKPAVIDRVQLVKTLRRSSCLLSGQFLATKFSFSSKSLDVSMQNNEVGSLSEQLSLKNFTGKDLDIRFYAPYLLGGLHVFSDESIQFFLNNKSKPVIFESEEDGSSFLYLVMPVSPNNQEH